MAIRVIALAILRLVRGNPFFEIFGFINAGGCELRGAARADCVGRRAHLTASARTSHLSFAFPFANRAHDRAP